jgi:hypothetical protein
MSCSGFTNELINNSIKQSQNMEPKYHHIRNIDTIITKYIHKSSSSTDDNEKEKSSKVSSTETYQIEYNRQLLRNKVDGPEKKSSS